MKIRLSAFCCLVVFSFSFGSFSLAQNVQKAEVLQQSEILQPNEFGKIPILEYHHIDPKDSRWGRSVQGFKNDLQWLYNNDYRLISLEDFIDHRFILPFGKKPLILTFDDGLINEFRYLEDGSIDPDCAIGVLDEFSLQHPDFGTAATFFVNDNPFGQKASIQKKMSYLVTTGRQIGYHTLNHTNLAKESLAGVKKILLDQAKALQSLVPDKTRLDSLAYPYGGVPKGDLTQIAGGRDDKEGHTISSYEIKLGLLVGAGPSKPLYDEVDPMRVPRIQTIDEEWKRHFGRLSGAIEANPGAESFTPFVSDGDPNVFTFLPKDKEKVAKNEFLKTKKVQFAGEQAIYPTEVAAILPPQVPAGQVSTQDKVISTQISAPSYQRKANFFSLGTFFGFMDKNLALKAVKALIAQKSRDLFSEFYWQLHFKVPLRVEGERLFYAANEGMDKVAEKFLEISPYYLLNDFKDELENLNPGLEPGSIAIIPIVSLFEPVTRPKLNNLQGIYLSASSAGSKTGMNLITNLKDHGGNLVVFDVKETDGHLYYPSKIELLKKLGGNDRIILKHPKNFIRYWHQRGIYLVARVTSFKDEFLAVKKPEWAIHTFGGGIWKGPEGQSWLDPSLPEVQDYVISVAEEAALLGVDEIQFDYVRFPTQGPLGSANYSFDEKKVEHYEIIRDFLKKAQSKLKPLGVKIGIDVYGIVSWNNGFDTKSTGQKIQALAPYIDVLYPMSYPSHFGPGFGGHKNPADEPYYFVKRTVEQFQEQLAGTQVEIRAWLQGFTYRVTNFTSDYVVQQAKALKDIGLESFVIWNASNKYDASWGSFGR